MAIIGNATPTFSRRDITVTLTGIADNQRAIVSFTGIDGGSGAQAAIGFLVGDVSSSRAVNVLDISAIKAHGGQLVTAGNFQFDLDASGSIDGHHVSAVKALLKNHSVTFIPRPALLRT